MSSSLNGTGVTFSNGLSQDIPAVGPNQTWQAVTRVAGTTYTNTTGRPIVVSTNCTASSSGTNTATVAGVVAAWGVVTAGGGQSNWMTFIVPNGATYVVSTGGGIFSIASANELR